MEYVELHCHSNFSFLDGAAFPEDLVARAHELGHPALALTDHNGLYGVVRFNQAALAKGVRPIFGAEITLDNDHHLLLLIKDATGYSNLSRLLSTAALENKKGEAKVRKETLASYSAGLIALSGCSLGEVPSALLNGDTDKAKQVACEYRELFGRDNFFLELQHHNLPAHEITCRRLAALGKELTIETVATNNVHYAVSDGRQLQDVLTCIKNHVTLDNAAGLLYPNAERSLKSSGQMIKRFRRYPRAIENTLRIAERCRFSLARLNTSLPDFPVPRGVSVPGYLRKLTYDGARERYDEITPAVRWQLEHELGIINKLNLAGYFLIVWDIARFCRINGILCQGRGSAANSAVCYCLGITAVDPIKLKLLFERFISEERKEPPDIDIDIANNRREEAIQYVYEKYGRDHAAMVNEVISYRGRSAVREVGKALGFSLDEVGQLAKQISHFSNPQEVIERLKEADLNPDNRRVQLLIDFCRRIRGFPRHIGIHVGGMIVTRRPLAEVVPIENATMPNRSVIQWDKDDVNDIGLVKIDLLGLGMLSLIDLALKLVKKHRGVTIDPARLGYDDPKVFDLICRADTVGIFQVESRAQMNTLPRHKPRCFYDLVVEVALIRPGPIQGGMVHPYLRRRNGEEEVTYPHPKLKPILARTLGIPLFQEQGMQVAVLAAGFTPSQADELRRAMGHKRSKERMDALSDGLINGMIKNGIDLDSAERIFAQLAAFADFGFAESHAASFALLVYVSAYLKVYFPAEFYCALLNSQPMGFYTPATVVYEARRRGMVIKNIDITKSDWDCTVEGDSVRLGLKYVKSFGDTAKEKIEAARNEQPFESIRDFVFRTGLDQLGLERLALSGAFRAFGVTRRQALWKVLALTQQSPGEIPLQTTETGSRLLPEMNVGESLVSDLKGVGLSTGPHPMTLVRATLKEQKILSADDLKPLPSGRTVTVAGVVVIRQRPMTAKGFMFLTLEDETGFFNIVVRPNLAKSFRKVIVFSSALIVKGPLEKRDGVTNVMGLQFHPLELGREDVKIKSRDFR